LGGETVDMLILGHCWGNEGGVERGAGKYSENAFKKTEGGRKLCRQGQGTPK